MGSFLIRVEWLPVTSRSHARTDGRTDKYKISIMIVLIICTCVYVAIVIFGLIHNVHNNVTADTINESTPAVVT